MIKKTSKLTREERAEASGPCPECGTWYAPGMGASVETDFPCTGCGMSLRFHATDDGGYWLHYADLDDDDLPPHTD